MPIGGMVLGGAIVLLIIIVVVVQSQTVSGKAPDFEMVVYQGQEVLGGDQVTLHEVLDQGKPIVLNFWAGLCPPCRAEMPGFQRIYDARGDEYIMLGVDIGPFVNLGGRNDALQFLSDFQITYPTAFSPSSSPVRDYGVSGMPTTVFLTPDGKMFDRHVGFLSEGEALQKLDRLLAASALPE